MGTADHAYGQLIFLLGSGPKVSNDLWYHIFLSPPPLLTLRIASLALRLAFRPSGWPTRPSG